MATRGRVVAGTPFAVVVTLAERSRRAAARATVTVSDGTSVARARAVVVPRGGRIRVGVAVTARAATRRTLAVSARVKGDARPRDNVAKTRVAVPDFAVAPARVLTGSFGGFGAQFNQNLYAQISRDAGVSDENVVDVERKVVELRPHLARLFFHRAAFADPDLMRSFVRTAQLAQRAGAAVHVTWQTSFASSPELEMPMFADVLADLVQTHGVTRLRWVTIQNEVNSTRVTMDAYERMYRLVDQRLRARGVRDTVRFMGGDLVAAPSPLRQTQADWFRFMATRMNDLLDAYSVHVFWDYWDTAKITKRLTDVRAIHDALPAEARKPLYVTEFGVRGRRAAGVGGPGSWDDGTPIESSNVGAFQQAWFALLAARLGYAGAIKWDAYFARYDRVPQSYGLIGPPQEGWPLRSAYNMTRLLTSTTEAGSRTLAVEGASGTKVVSAFAGRARGLTLVGLDAAAASLNAVSPRTAFYRVAGLPARTTFTLLSWNLQGDGALATVGTVASDETGLVALKVPLHAVFALTTRP